MKDVHLYSLPQTEATPKLRAQTLFLTKGLGQHPVKLISFELALRSAQLEAQNLVRVSSIYPPFCKKVSIEEGVKHLHPGQITFSVLSETALYGEDDGRYLGAAVGLALPPAKDRFGYIFETHTYDMDEAATHKEAVQGATILLASSMDPSVDIYNYSSIPSDLRKQITNDAMVSVTKTKKGMWTTAIAVAVYII